ncbi:unnamed protein product [Ixodes hexagonus]
MNVHGIRRNVKNVVRNYSDAQVKVREATSNDPWGPPSTLMGEIADLSYNVVAFTEIMQMIWKRLNDHGKNWRHVYKALVLLEYLIKTGSEKVAQQCKENIFAIQTLKDFQHTEDNKDQGVNVREKSKQLVALLKDDERLRAERARALKAKERFAQATARIGSETLAKYGGSGSRRDSYGSDAASPRGEGDGASGLSSELECARPQTAGEEELQLQLALAMSKEEAEQEERVRKNDDLRLQMALSESQQSAVGGGAVAATGSLPLQNGGGASSSSSHHHQQRSGLDDLLGLSLGAAAAAAEGGAATDPWGMPLYDGTLARARETTGVSLLDKASRDYQDWVVTVQQGPDWFCPRLSGGGSARPVGVSIEQSSGHSGSSRRSLAQAADPWCGGGAPATNGGDLDEFDILSKRSTTTSPICEGNPAGGGGMADAFALGGLRGALAAPTDEEELARRKTPESFLGPNSNLVNLDALVTTRPPGEQTAGALFLFLPLKVAPIGVPVGVPAPNPFAAPLTNAAAAAATTPLVPTAGNPFQASKPPPPTINQLRSQNSAFPTPQQPPLPRTTNMAAFPLASQAVVPPQQNPFM